MVTLSRVMTSCGGTVSVTIRRSTLLMRETNGGTRNRPGPFAPVKRPSTKITPRSYCCTTRIAERARISRTRTRMPMTTNTSGFIISLLAAWKKTEEEKSLLLSHSTRPRRPTRHHHQAIAPTPPPGQPLPAVWHSGVLDRTTSLFYRSEEHTSELQSQSNLVCRLLLEKKK